MHLIFTDEELKYINTSVFGWPIKEECPKKIELSIKKKKKLLDNQSIGENDGGN